MQPAPSSKHLRVLRECPVPDEAPRQGISTPCAHCEKPVHNFAARTRNEIEALVARHREAGTMSALCIRFSATPEGMPRADAFLRTRRASFNRRMPLIVLALVAGFTLVASIVRSQVPALRARDFDTATPHATPTLARSVREKRGGRTSPHSAVRHLAGCPVGDPFCE